MTGAVRMGRALWISAATMASRVLGLVRDQLFAWLVGANAYSDANPTTDTHAGRGERTHVSQRQRPHWPAVE